MDSSATSGKGLKKRKITILTLGTRGDVQPCLALAIGLKAAGYDVMLGADLDFEESIRAHEIDYAPLRLNLRQYFHTPEGQEAMHGSGEVSRERTQAMILSMLDDCWAAAQGADALIYDTMLTPAYHIAEKLGLPAIMTSVMPNMSPTRAFPLIGGPKLGLGRIGNRLSYEIYRLAWIKAYPWMARWCEKTLQAKPRSRFLHYGYRGGRPVPVLYSYSELVLPSPPDWNADTLASGYWLLGDDETWQPPPALAEFIAAGPPPVYVGFGSMVGSDPAELTRLVVPALAKARQRAVLDAGWGGMVDQDLPDSIFFAEKAPHHWLLPRMTAVVQHGGAGTVAASLRFGKPSVLCPFVTDHFFWGEVLRQRGLGGAPIPHRELTVDRLAQAIEQTVADVEMRRRVEAFSHELRREDGVGRAVKFIWERFGPPLC